MVCLDKHAHKNLKALSAIVLAAGTSRRMGVENKLLATVNGKPMIVRAVETLPVGLFEQVIVVTGYQREEVEQALTGCDVRFVRNEDYQEGLATSLAAGLRAVKNQTKGVLVALGDMPLVSQNVVVDLVSAFELDGDICAPSFANKRGNPILWGRQYFQALQSVRGDKGGRDLLEKHRSKLKLVDVDCNGVLMDFDTKHSLDTL